jgi:histidine phosphotransfer protein HptB
MNDEVPVNREMLSELRELLADNFNELIDRYFSDSKARFTTLEQATSSLDFKVIQYEAHGIKGSSRNMGANRLASILERVEQLGATQQPQDLSVLFAQAKIEFARVISDLEQFRIP